MFEAIRPTFHLILHVLVPALTAFWITQQKSQSTIRFSNNGWHAFGVMMLTMIVDADHLLAEPIYQAGRCSINFHPLHTPIPILIYVLLCWPPKTRIIGLGLTIHMLLDGLDCWMIIS